MGLIDIFSDLKGPVFIKDDSDAERQLEYLKTLPPTPEVDREIKLVEAGIIGEKNIRFELENGHIPCYVLHDLYLEYDGLSAQIDYLIICRKCNYVVECKNLYGNIEIDSQGNFSRTVQYGKHYKKEGLYSPITQNERHIRLIKQRIRDKSIIHKLMFNEGEDEIWKSIVVLANPKTVLNNRYAKKEIKEKVIRADQLVNFIKKTEAESKNATMTDSQMKDSAEKWLSRCKINPVDYTAKFADLMNTDSHQETSDQSALTASISSAGNPNSAPICQRCGVPMVKRVARKGKNAGSEFWGCPNFPSCRNIVPIKDIIH